MKQIKTGDYLVALYDNKPILVRVTQWTEHEVTGKHEYKDTESDVTVSMSDVQANLGEHPHVGKVYGCNTERLIDVTETAPIRVLDWYFEADDEVKEAVHAKLIEGATLLRNHNIHSILQAVKAKVVLNTSAKLTPKSVLGSYMVKGGEDENPDVITIKYHAEATDLLPLILCHEAGHGIWHRLLPVELKTQWLRQFSLSATSIIDSEAMVAAATTLLETESLKVEDPNVQPYLDQLVKRLEELTHLRKKDIVFLLKNDKPFCKNLLEVVCRIPYYHGAVETHVTEYANTNVEEFFCECLACFCTDKVLPESVKPLMAATIESLRGKLVNNPS